jgi:predicted CoA-binding protein
VNKLTLVFGYSDNPDRYSNKAYHLLKKNKLEVIGVNPRNFTFDVFPNSFHTLTLYVNAEISNKFKDDILKLNFKRIIFNPGTENELLEKACLNKNIEVVHGCTLVMLNTNQY